MRSSQVLHHLKIQTILVFESALQKKRETLAEHPLLLRAGRQTDSAVSRTMGVSNDLDVFYSCRGQLLYLHAPSTRCASRSFCFSSAVSFSRHPGLTRKTLRLTPPL